MGSPLSGTIAASRNSLGSSVKKRLKALESRIAKGSSFSNPVVSKRRGYTVLMGIGMRSSLIVPDLRVGRAISYRPSHLGLFEKTKKANCFDLDRGNQKQGRVIVGIRYGMSLRMSKSGVK